MNKAEMHSLPFFKKKLDRRDQNDSLSFFLPLAKQGTV